MRDLRDRENWQKIKHFGLKIGSIQVYLYFNLFVVMLLSAISIFYMPKHCWGKNHFTFTIFFPSKIQFLVQNGWFFANFPCLANLAFLARPLKLVSQSRETWKVRDFAKPSHKHLWVRVLGIIWNCNTNTLIFWHTVHCTAVVLGTE